MHLPRRFVFTGLMISVLTAGLFRTTILQAQPQGIQGPILGFIPDTDGISIRPILGIPGASSLGDRLQLDVDIRRAVLSPKQDYALAVRAEDGQVIIVDLADGVPVVRPIDVGHPGADLIAVSPTGSAAAIYRHESKAVQVIGSLPHTPTLIHEFDASHVPGRAASLALSDDGTIALVKFADADDRGWWLLDSSGASRRMVLDRPSAAAFLPNRQDAIVIDDATRTAFLVLDVGRTATPIPLISVPDGIESFSSVSAAEDGGRVFLADIQSGQIAIVDIDSRAVMLTSCQCQPTGLYPLHGASIFRLGESSSEPVMVLDASSGEPRIMVIPPAASAVALPR
jgi:DNA-binding beta-propeller fold protein YncE